jgi:hypothetical protein
MLKATFASAPKSIFDSSPLREIVVHKGKNKYKNKQGAKSLRLPATPRHYRDPEDGKYKGQIDVVVHTTSPKKKKRMYAGKKMRQTRRANRRVKSKNIRRKHTTNRRIKSKKQRKTRRLRR